MRFRLATNGQGGQGSQDATGGIGRAFQNLAMLPMLQAQAAEEAQNGEMKRQLMESQQRQSDAHAALFGAQAAAERTQQQRGTFSELAKTAALISKVPTHQLDEFASYAQTGQLPQKYEMAPSLPGPTMPRPEYANADVGGQIMRTLGLLQGGLTVGDKNIDNVAQAQGRFQKQDAVRQVQADPGSAGRVGQSFAAAEGHKLIENIGNTGRGYNQFTGEGSTLSPGVAALFDQGERAQIGQRNASAASSYASAEHSRASTRKVNQDIEQGVRTGSLQVVTGPNGEITVVDKVNRTAQPVLGADGRPVVKGAAGGGGKPMTEGQAKANIYGGRMLEADNILSEMEEAGTYRPGAIKGFTEGVVGAVPIIGDSLREGAGAATNWTQSPRQQQVDQARRDFINAVLRRESGAAISPSEFSNADKQYFPQLGDSKEVLAQKRRNRQIAATLMLQEVPEAQRYRLGSVPKATPAASPTAPQSGATGSWDAPAGGRSVKVDY